MMAVDIPTSGEDIQILEDRIEELIERLKFVG